MVVLAKADVARESEPEISRVAAEGRIGVSTFAPLRCCRGSHARLP